MQSYEVVREVENLCANNQMRDIFFEEIETDDPVGWLRDFVKGKDVELTVDEKESGDLTVFVESGGVRFAAQGRHGAGRRHGAGLDPDRLPSGADRCSLSAGAGNAGAGRLPGVICISGKAAAMRLFQRTEVSQL